MRKNPMQQSKYTLAIVFLLLILKSHISYSVPVTEYSESTGEIMFIENQEDNNYFVTSVSGLEPRLTGGNTWTSLKNSRQRSLAYVNNARNYSVNSNYYLDMWEENSPIAYPYTTHRCIDSYSNCNPDTGTSIFSPPLVDKYGFYGVIPATGWAHAEISSAFFSYLKSMNVGETLTRTMNFCRTDIYYDPTKGERCVDQTSGRWERRTIHHLKDSHLILKRTGAITNLMVDSAGNPIILPGSKGCESATRGSRSGVICEFLDYDFNSSGRSYSSISIDTTLMNGLTLNSNDDLQKSVDKSYWRSHGSTLNLNYLKENNKIYLFMSTALLKNIISSNSENFNIKNLINFLFYNSTSPESGYYELSGTTDINVQPREFSVSITSSDYTSNPYKAGRVGEDILTFNYELIKSAPISSTSFDISISQTIPGTWNNDYCLFYPENSTDINHAVPIPAYVSFTQEDGSYFRQLINCDHGKISLQENNIIESRAAIIDPDPSGSNNITTQFYNLNLEFDLTDESTRRTTNDSFWEGEVHQSGTLTIKAIWNE
jgi:hypothetical protein